MPPDFDPQPHLHGAALMLRPLMPQDFDGLYAAAADPRIWAGHPARDRHKRDVFAPYFEFLLARATALVVIDRQTNAIIGTSSFYTAPDRPQDIAIGFTFLAVAYWGGETNRAMKGLMLDHIFRDRDEGWFHIDPTNQRSQRATAKLGATFAYETRMALGPAPADWLCYRLTRAAWAEGVRRNPPPAPSSGL